MPKLCSGTAVDPATVERFIMGRLNTSALDGAVAALSARADGEYSKLLKQQTLAPPPPATTAAAEPAAV